MTFSGPVRRRLAALLTSLLVASGLALAPAALASAAGSASAERVSCRELDQKLAVALAERNSAHDRFELRRAELQRAIARYEADPTRRNRVAVEEATERRDISRNRFHVKRARWAELRERYERNC